MTKKLSLPVIALGVLASVGPSVNALAQTASLTIGSVSGTAGQNAVVPVFIGGGSTYAGAQLDIDFSPALTVPNPTAACAPVGAPAGSVATVVNGNRLRIVVVKISGTALETFGDGLLVNCTFAVAAGAAGTLPLAASNASVSSPLGVALQTTAASGAVVLPGGPGCS